MFPAISLPAVSYQNTPFCHFWGRSVIRHSAAEIILSEYTRISIWQFFSPFGSFTRFEVAFHAVSHFDVGPPT